jgi:hypothetical protein
MPFEFGLVAIANTVALIIASVAEIIASVAEFSLAQALIHYKDLA